jgi:hypothetical protein
MIVEWFFGFHRPCLRNLKGNIDVRYWLGHCEAWGYTADDTWVFLDPRSKGFKVRVMHRYDDVVDQLEAYYAICESIVKIKNDEPEFSLPPFTLMSCAAICGALVKIRALVPSTLKRKLLLNGAELVHERNT